MATIKKPLARQLTKTERKALTERYYSFINYVDGLTDKNLNPQIKVDLKKFLSALRKNTPYLRKF